MGRPGLCVRRAGGCGCRVVDVCARRRLCELWGKNKLLFATMARLISFAAGFGGSCFAYQMLHDKLKYSTLKTVEHLQDGERKFPGFRADKSVARRAAKGGASAEIEGTIVDTIVYPLKNDVTKAARGKLDQLVRETHREVKEALETKK